ncbi:M28 family metallopeptidase [Vagococcus fluvialis]|uniref:M28 family metallopeptidase n=1 Tax=Vagococcus fluvialis TaxID=2738 RepID=UPI003D0C5C01
MKKILVKIFILMALGLHIQPIFVEANSEYDNNSVNQAVKFSKIIELKFKDRENHSISEKNKKVNKHSRSDFFKWIREELTDKGVPAEKIEEQEFKKYSGEGDDKFDGKNLIVTLPGKDTKKQIIVGAHYDGTGYGDNGSGTAFMLSLIQKLSEVPLPYNVKLVFFDSEENGKIGSQYFVKKMNFFEKNNTLTMINIDSIAFGDYTNIYGGVYNDQTAKVEKLEVYQLAIRSAQNKGIKVLQTQDLDGYYKKNKQGPPIENNTLYTNPWTQKNPAPNREIDDQLYVSPASGSWGDHQSFVEIGIPYLSLEATNWYAYDPDKFNEGFDGYIDTNNLNAGDKGRFMNTKFDTLEQFEKYFSEDRLKEHYKVYGTLLFEMLQHPNGDFKRKTNIIPLVLISVVILLLSGFLCILLKKKIKTNLFNIFS